MPFTSDEVQSTVEQLVRSQIRRPYDTLGVRRTDVSFSDIQEVAAGVFILYPRAPFYCVWLGAQQALEALEQEQVILDKLDAALLALGRRVLPVDDLTSLFNARAALRELSQAGIQQPAAMKDISKAPAFQRFKSNTDRFLSDAGSAVKSNGEIVATPNEARLSLASLIVQLEGVHQSLVETIGFLSKSIEDYNALSLPSIVSQSVINNALKLVGNHVEDLSKKTAEERLQSLKQVVLDVIASKSVVSQFGSFGGVVDVYSLTGVGNAFADVDRPALPASLHCVRPGPYVVAPVQNSLDLYLDAPLSPRSVTEVDSVATLTGGALFTITASWPGDVTIADIIYVTTAGQVTRWVITSFNAGRTEASTSGPGTVPVGTGVAVEVCPPPSAAIALPHSYAASIPSTQPEQAYVIGPNTFYGYIIGDGVNPLRPGGPPNNNQVKLRINGVLYTLPLLVSSTLSGGATEALPRTVEQICYGLNFGLGGSGYKAEPYLAPRRFYGKVDIAAIAGETGSFTLIGAFGNFGSLGVVAGDWINVLSGGQAGFWKVTTVNPTVLEATQLSMSDATTEAGVFIEIGPIRRYIRIVPLDYKAAIENLDTVEVVYEEGSVSSRGAISIGLPVGALARSRQSTAKDLAEGINKSSSLVFASTQFIPTSTVTAKGGAMAIKLDAAGPVLEPFEMVRIPSGINRGDYYASTLPPASPVDIPLMSALPAPNDLVTGLPAPITVELGKEYVVLASKNSTLSSQVTVRGNVVHELFEDLALEPYPFGVLGTTYTFQLPTAVRGLEKNDLLQLFTTDYNNPSSEYVIIAIDGRLLTLAWPISNGSSWTFDAVPPPFARLHAGSSVDFTSFKTKMDGWLAQPEQKPAYFTELYRKINPLVANTSPAASDIGDARSQLHSLSKTLSVAAKAAYAGTLPALEEGLRSYVVVPLGPVDSLIRTYKEKGADRAVDLICMGRFRDFFNSTAQTVSYAGDFQEKMRSVVMNDLPVRKVGRLNDGTQKLISRADTPDKDYNLDDTEGQSVPPDPV